MSVSCAAEETVGHAKRKRPRGGPYVGPSSAYFPESVPYFSVLTENLGRFGFGGRTPNQLLQIGAPQVRRSRCHSGLRCNMSTSDVIVSVLLDDLRGVSVDLTHLGSLSDRRNRTDLPKRTAPPGHSQNPKRTGSTARHDESRKATRASRKPPGGSGIPITGTGSDQCTASSDVRACIARGASSA